MHSPRYYARRGQYVRALLMFEAIMFVIGFVYGFVRGFTRTMNEQPQVLGCLGNINTDGEYAVCTCGQLSDPHTEACEIPNF